MTKTTTLKIALAFSLAVLLGASLFVASESIFSNNGSNAQAKNTIMDLLNNPTFGTKACCGV